MKTAEEILDEKKSLKEYPSCYHYTTVIQAMEAYASQFKQSAPLDEEGVERMLKEVENKLFEAYLTPEQIKSWRNVIYFYLEDKQPGAGAYALIMPESEVIAFWRKSKTILESPPERPKHIQNKTKCSHDNSISGSNGKYCIDCEKYV